MFIKLNKEDVYSITRTNGGRDSPCGDVYIDLDKISHIDGQFVVIEDYVFCCSDKVVEKIVFELGVIDFSS